LKSSLLGDDGTVHLNSFESIGHGSFQQWVSNRRYRQDSTGAGDPKCRNEYADSRTHSYRLAWLAAQEKIDSLENAVNSMREVSGFLEEASQ